MNEPQAELRYRALLQEADKLISSIEIQLSPVLSNLPSLAEKDAEGFGVEFLGEINSIVRRLADLSRRIVL